jgi:hypothetical protein
MTNALAYYSSDVNDDIKVFITLTINRKERRNIKNESDSFLSIFLLLLMPRGGFEPANLSES